MASFTTKDMTNMRFQLGNVEESFKREKKGERLCAFRWRLWTT